MNKELEDTALAYVLGELDEAQTREFEQALDGDPQLAAHVRELSLAHETLALSAPEMEAPAGVPDLVLASAKSKSPETPQTEDSKVVSFWYSPAWAVAAGFAICLAAYAFLTLRSQQEQMNQLRQEIVAIQEAPSPLQGLQVIQFAPQEDRFAGSQAVALWNSEEETAYLVVGTLPELPHDHTYQVWALDDTQEAPIPGSTFGNHEEFLAFEGLQPSPSEGRSLRFAVSIEPTGGSPAPTGPVVLVSNQVQSRG